MDLLHPGAGLHGHEYSSPAIPAPNSGSPSPRIALHRSPFSAPTRPSSYQDTSAVRSSIRSSGQLSPTKLRDIHDRALGQQRGGAGEGEEEEILPSYEYLILPRPPGPDIDTKAATGAYPTQAASPTAAALRRGETEAHCRCDILDHIRAAAVEKAPGPVDDYDALDEEKEVESVVEDTASDRDILAVICQVPNGDLGTVEIYLEDGSRWNAGPSVNGVLELVKTDPVTGERMIARWVPRGTSRRNSLRTPSRRGSEILEPRYQFSFINPGTRRHPILATLTQDTLKISNTYSLVSNSEEKHPTISSSRTSSSLLFSYIITSPPFFISFLCLYLPHLGLILHWIGSWFVYSPDGEHVDSDTNADPKILVIYDEQRLLIEVSAVWIALKQGWCPSFRYGESSSPGLAKIPTPPSSSKLERLRPFSLTSSGTGKHGRTRSNTVTSIPESIDSSHGTVRSCRSVFARATFSASTLQSESSEERAPPNRTVSNGAAFMQKAAGRKAGRESSNWSSGSENDESRASSPRRKRGSRSNSVDITEGVRLSSLLVLSPRFQIRSLPNTPKSPTKARSPLSATTNQKTENKAKRVSNSQLLEASNSNNMTENQRPGELVVDASLPLKSRRTPEPPTPGGKKEKENGRFSLLIRFYKGESGKRS
ncbi:hypothetical protein V501_01424 [Pseudogymnoascus sp. VKM F-4519 (FW-2642)]|nr:hypothetical protein V501_01424 [Pseudogymnoascus sp. VKM F-4519 (FW-2642)]